MAEDRDFRKLLQARWDQGKNVCVGLDTDPTKLPNGMSDVHAFNVEILKVTAPYASSYKPNAAFYEANGRKGWEDLHKLMLYARAHYPEIPFLYDAKRGDNANSNGGYVHSIFDRLGFDAVTVHPYMGSEALKPFLDRGDKGIIVVVRTSNPGASEIEDLEIGLSEEQCAELAEGPSGSTPNLAEFATGALSHTLLLPLHRVIALKVANHWNTNGNCCAVVGATCPDHLKAVRGIIREMPILIPGLGAQGGDLERAVVNGKNSQGDGIIISSSRSILYASNGADFAEAAAEEACRMNATIQLLRQ